jgi:gag-polyprotein putative aspartyl protease
MIPFSLETEESLILVPTFVEDEEISLVLDTGASHTIIDLTKLLIIGYRLSDSLGTVQFETAKGVVEAYVFKIKYIKALGHIKRDIKVCSYDFLGNNVLSEIDGVLGLDFFKDTELWINFKKFFIDLKK